MDVEFVGAGHLIFLASTEGSEQRCHIVAIERPRFDEFVHSVLNPVPDGHKVFASHEVHCLC